MFAKLLFFFLNRRVVIAVVVALKALSQRYDKYLCHLYRELPSLPGERIPTELSLASPVISVAWLKIISVIMKNHGGSIQKKYWQHFHMILFIFQHEDTTRKFVSLLQIALKLIDATKTAQTRGAARGDIFARHLAAHQRIWNWRANS